MHYAKIRSMNKLSILILLLLFNFFSFAQNNMEFTFDITFETNVISINSDDEFAGPNYKFKLEKYKSSCKFGEIEYSFQKKDTLLLRYFSDFKKLFEQSDFYRNFNKTCPELWNHTMHTDGIQTIFWYKSDSTKISFGADDGICDFNSLYDNILDNFFNIVIYVVNQPSSKGKLSESKLSKLEYLEGATGFAPIRLVRPNPLTYRLKGRVYERSYEEVLTILNGLPKAEPTYIEVGGRFYVNEFDSFYRRFKDFLKEPNRIIWIPENDRSATELKKLGVDKKSMKKVKKKSKPSA
jgi:hypothetical protein